MEKIIPARIIPARIEPIEIKYNNPLDIVQKPINIFEYEYWLPISLPNIQPYYFISTYGRVFSTKYNKFFKCSINGRGYQEISMRTLDNKRVQYRLHRVVMMTFNPINDMDKYMVNRIDGIKTHNWIWNLEWCDNTYNIKEAMIYGLKKPIVGELHGMCKITDYEAEMVCQLLIQQQYTYDEISYIVGGNVSYSMVNSIANGRTHKHLYYKYGLMNLEKRLCKLFTNEQLHSICKYFQDHKHEQFNSVYELYTEVLKTIGIIFDPNIHRTCMANIKYKKYYNSICDLYDY